MWVKLDDSLWRNPKIGNLIKADRGMEALGLHMLALSFCGDQLSNGLVDKSDLKRMTNAHPHRVSRWVSTLVSQEVWHEVTGGGKWIIHDFAQYNPSSEQILIRRQNDLERKRAWRQRQNALSQRPEQISSHAPDPEPVMIDYHQSLIEPVETVDNLPSELDKLATRLATMCDDKNVASARKVIEQLQTWMDQKTIDELIGSLAGRYVARPSYLLRVAQNRSTG